MALLDRVATLIKANVNDLVDKAENPEKLLKQLLLDMQNQFLQVKTQVAIAIADQHLLEKKQQENVASQQDWVRKAELALVKNQEDLARTALERSLTFENAAKNFAQQLEDQAHQVRTLREALHRLEQKMAETKTRTEVLLAQHRRTRAVTAAQLANVEQHPVFDRMQVKVTEAEALVHGYRMVTGETDAEQRLDRLEKSDRVDRMLAELKAKTG